MSNKPRLLVLTGPQGSGNHLFSKIFAQHPSVYGWRMQTYWEGHHHEPFAKEWQMPSCLYEFEWQKHEYIFTSISCPYARNQEYHIPKYEEFLKISSYYADVKVAIIGRDKNILELQEKRVRQKITYDQFIEQLDILEKYNPTYLSHELYNLYGNRYLQSISKLLDFPIAVQDPSQDANRKYVVQVDTQDLDLEVNKAVQES